MIHIFMCIIGIICMLEAEAVEAVATVSSSLS